MNPAESNPAQSDAAETLEQLGALTLGDWLFAAGLVVASVLLAGLARRLVARLAGQQLAPLVARLLARLSAAIVFLFGLFYAAQKVGISVAPLLGLVGLFGLAFAFAFQEVLENFIAGIFLSARRPFAQGDEITTADHQGFVEDISLRELTLRTYDGRLVFVPNSAVWKNPIVNHTARDSRRTTLELGVGYDSDLERVADLLVTTLEEIDGVVSEPAPQAFAYEYGASSINFAVRFWHDPGIGDEWQVRDRVVKATHRALGEAGIEIPFPQRVITMADRAEAPA